MRTSPTTFDYILAGSNNKLMKNWTNFISTPISPEEKLMLCLRYLSTGHSFHALAFSFRLGKSTMAACIYETVEAIWTTFHEIHLKSSTEDDFQQIAVDFYNIWQFSHCIGALDGKHIKIKCPVNLGLNF